MIHLELQPEVEAQIASEAAGRGISIELRIAEIISSYAEDEEGLREGLADIAAGRTRPAVEVFAELHERHGIRG